MDRRIQELIDFTRKKFGLENYRLQRHRLYRDVNIFNETVYTLCMEWFPAHVTEHEDDGSNPEGTAVIEIDLNSNKFARVIFVEGKSYSQDGISFVNSKINDIIQWIERETGLKYGKHFKLHKESEGELLFNACYEGVAVSPAGFIEVKFDQEGKLTLFSCQGQFPSEEMVKEETYALSLETVEHLAKEQLKLVEFPSYEQKKLIPVYAVEEIYVTNDGKSVFPYERIAAGRPYLKIDQTIYWDQPINEPLNRKEIRWFEDVTAEQAFSFEPSPDSFPITKAEQEKCMFAVMDFLRREYPNDTGKWILKTLHRDKGYILASLMANRQDNHVFQRKMTVMIDTKNFQAVNYIDNQPLLAFFDQFQAPDKVTIDKEEAYEKIKKFYELKPLYFYDFAQKQYILCGKLDCRYGVNALNGDVIVLDDLQFSGIASD